MYLRKAPAVILAAAASAILLVVLVAACGGDSEETIAIPAREGDKLDVGVLYDYDMGIHCGVSYLGEFNGRFWYEDSPPFETGGGQFPPDDWPLLDGNFSVDGLMKLVDTDLIEYSIVGTDVVIEYRPSEEEPPPCA